MSIEIEPNAIGFTLSSGKWVEAYGGVCGLSIGEPDGMYAYDPMQEPMSTGAQNQSSGGYRGGQTTYDAYERFTLDERREIAAHMILRWMEWGQVPLAMLRIVRMERAGYATKAELQAALDTAVEERDWDECRRLEALLEEIPR